jgi:hypothetical protein
LKSIAYHVEAIREADSAAAFYFKNDPMVLHDFLTVLERVMAEIQAAPHRWPREGRTSAQRRQVKRFPYTVFYLNEPEKNLYPRPRPHQPPSGLLENTHLG